MEGVAYVEVARGFFHRLIPLVVTVASVDVPWAGDWSAVGVWYQVVGDGLPDDLPVRC